MLALKMERGDRELREVGSLLKQERARKSFSYKLQEEYGPPDSLILAEYNPF